MAKIMGAVILPEDERKFLSGDGVFVFPPVRKIFQFYADAPTVDQDPQELHSFPLEGSTLAAAGQSLRAVYAGGFANNAHPKYVWFDWFGQVFQPLGPAAPGGAFRIEILAVRAGGHVLRVSAFLSWNALCSTQYAEISGIDFSEPQNLILKAETPDAAGDVTLRTAQCEWTRDI